jgi:hypothetical protein
MIGDTKRTLEFDLDRVRAENASLRAQLEAFREGSQARLTLRQLVGWPVMVGSFPYRITQAELSAHPQVRNMCEVKLTLEKEPA